MNIQEWLTQLLSSPAAEPLDWERYRVTMGASTWKALWRDIAATQAYEDGLDAALRLLQATRQHRVQLSQRGYQSSMVLLYRSILLMLDKADRWDEYLAAWDVIRAQTNHSLPVLGEAATGAAPHVAPSVRRANGGFGVPPLRYGASPPKAIPVHFLEAQLHRKTLIERRLAQERAGRLVAQRRPSGRGALTGEEIQSRLAEIRESAG
jgi:hypothetical protein